MIIIIIIIIIRRIYLGTLISLLIQNIASTIQTTRKLMKRKGFGVGCRLILVKYVPVSERVFLVEICDYQPTRWYSWSVCVCAYVQMCVSDDPYMRIGVVGTPCFPRQAHTTII